MKALVIQHDQYGGPGIVGDKLKSLGFEIDSFQVLDDLSNPVSTRPFPDPAKYELLVVMGSTCLLYTSPSPRDRTRSRMPSSA